MVPWNDAYESVVKRDNFGFMSILAHWNCKKATLIQRQRYQYINNLMTKGYRSSSYEYITSAYRDRNSDQWCDIKQKHIDPCKAHEQVIDIDDSELAGRLSGEEIHIITNMLSEENNILYKKT